MKYLWVALCLLASNAGASETWRYPNSEPCQVGDVNLCWTTDYLPQSVVDMIGFDDDEVCDGDLISNSGVREGKPFSIPYQKVLFDRDYMDEQGIYYLITEDNRACIQSLSNGVWHYVFECGNRVRMLHRYVGEKVSVPSETRRGALSGLVTQMVGGYQTTGSSPLLPQYTGSEDMPIYVHTPTPEPEPIPPVPLPASVWLMVSGLGLLILSRKRRMKCLSK